MNIQPLFVFGWYIEVLQGTNYKFPCFQPTRFIYECRMYLDTLLLDKLLSLENYQGLSLPILPILPIIFLLKEWNDKKPLFYFKKHKTPLSIVY